MTTLYLNDKFITSLEELQELVIDINNPATPLGRQLIASACDGVLGKWLKEDENAEKISDGINMDELCREGDVNRLKIIKKALIGSNEYDEAKYYSDNIEIVMPPSRQQINDYFSGKTSTLDFQIKCKTIIDELVPLQVMGVSQNVNMNISGVQTIQFRIPSFDNTCEEFIALTIDGIKNPLWKEKAIQYECYYVDGIEIRMIYVEGGTFNMGAQKDNEHAMNYDPNARPAESPVHVVSLNSFYICETQVTQDLWKSIMNSNPSHRRGTNLPVENVAWSCYDKNKDIQSFLNKLNKRLKDKIPDKYVFALPTEAQWEYAARGGKQNDSSRYSGGDKIEEVAWYNGNSGEGTHDVKEGKRTNSLNLFNMSGNVWEWCGDAWHMYPTSDANNPEYPGGDWSNRILRGGSFRCGPKDCRVTKRKQYPYDYLSDDVGFRLALVQKEIE